VGGSRKLVVTWEPPARAQGIQGFRVYKDNESQFYGSCDANTRRMDVNVTTSASPSPSAVFVSSFTALSESEKIQAIGTPTTEAAAVPDPTPSTETTVSGAKFSFCTEVGTELEFPFGAEVTQWIESCSEWYGLKLPNRPRVNLAKGTLVKVWIPVEEILSDHRVAVDGNGMWATGAEINHEIRESQKQCVTVKPGGEYRAKESGVELHNLKNLSGDR
jgi:hypothetical protein